MKKHNQEGVGHLLFILILLVITGVIGFAGWRVWEQREDADGDTESSESAVPDETGEFKREDGIVFSNVRINNLEVIKLPDGRYRAFYHSGPSGVQSAISTDGKKFTEESGNRVEQGVMPATVQLVDGRWRMYYASDKQLKSAVSKDAYTFTAEEGVRLNPGRAGQLDEFGIFHPSIVKLPDGSFKLFYDGQFKEGQGPFWRIMSATSKDGLNWTKDEGSRIPLDEGEVNTLERFKFEHASSPTALYKDGMYTIYFNAQGGPFSRSGIWRASSGDGIRFQVEKAPILAVDPAYAGGIENAEGGPKGMPQDSFLIEVDGKTRIFFWTSNKGYQSALK